MGSPKKYSIRSLHQLQCIETARTKCVPWKTRSTLKHRSEISCPAPTAPELSRLALASAATSEPIQSLRMDHLRRWSTLFKRGRTSINRTQQRLKGGGGQWPHTPAQEGPRSERKFEKAFRFKQKEGTRKWIKSANDFGPRPWNPYNHRWLCSSNSIQFHSFSFHLKHLRRIALQQRWLSRARHNIHYKTKIRYLRSRNVKPRTMLETLAKINLNTKFSKYQDLYVVKVNCINKHEYLQKPFTEW